MKRISSLESFIDFRRIIIEEPEKQIPCLVLCAGTGGQASGSNDIMRIIKRYIIEHNLHDKINLRITGCLGFCEMDPFIVVEPGRNLYPRVKIQDVPKIIHSAIDGKIIEELIYQDRERHINYCSQSEIPFFKYQTRTILGKNQNIDPIRIYNYINQGGYAAFEKVMTKPDPSWIINEVKTAELRGRGGAGFPTGVKWDAAQKAGNGLGKKFLVCNADEGDPGAYMDRSLLEGNPHLVIEGMIIAGIAIGATKGFIYVRSEYPLALKHTQIAIRQARDLGILGEKILGSEIHFDIEIIRGAGAFVCGEETALIKSIEGQMGQPRQRPPYPVEKGIWGYPTCINNVETLANVPIIINKGADEYKKIGIPGSRGTKIFSLVGKIKNTGLVEVPFGTTIHEIVYNIGGGPPGKAMIKAIQTGGPSGGCIPESMFDLPIDYESLSEAGSIMGSGGMIVMDENTCMVDIAKYFTNFLQQESCGKCSICREGTQRMYEILNDITEGRGKMEDIEILEDLGKVIKDVSLCGLGQTAANPMLSTLRYFRNEYIDHIVKKQCNACVCKEIISSPCHYTCPIDTEASLYISLIAKKEYAEALKVIKETNPFASTLARVCNHPCESKCKAGESGDPIAIKDLKRFVTDYGLKHNLYTETERPEKSNGVKVAIIGSGPAGLTCGFYLAKKGYEVTVFEKESKPGGMLVLGIPEYRLPRNILETDIKYILSSGIEIRTNAALGVDFTIDEFGKRIGIIGGGNTAIDSARRVLRAEISDSVAMLDTARSALRKEKTDKITIFYRRTIKEIPAYKEEVEDALQEGIKIEFLTAPKRIITREGKLVACEFLRMKMGEKDESGRRIPVPVEGSEFIEELDTLIVSISESPDISFLKNEGLQFSKYDTVRVNPETFETNRAGIFAGGDLVTGPNTVVDAVASGKIAAASIDQYLSGKEIRREYKLTRPSRYIEPVEITEDPMDELLSTNRPKISRLSPEKRKNNLNEVTHVLSEKQAAREAQRCLRCDLETTDGQKFLETLMNISKEQIV